jgi:hypothetical protein
VTLNVRASGAWGAKTTAYKRVSSAWAAWTNGYKRVSGAWVSFFAVALAASPSSVSKSGLRPGTLSQPVTLTKAATGVWLTGGGSISVSGSGTSFTFSSTAVAGPATLTRTGTYRFTATDGTGQIADVPVSFEHIGSA